MRNIYFAVLMSLAAPAPAFAQADLPPEVAFVGQLRSLTLTPRDREAERRAQAASGEIIISNSCGAASVNFRVIRSARRLPREVRTTSRLGEWCNMPVPLSQNAVLVLMTRQGRELLESYEIVEQDGAAYALFLDPAQLLDRYSPELRRQLGLQMLPEPLEYDTPDIPPDRLAEWVSHRPALELRNGQVWIVRAIPLTQVVPGYPAE